MLNEWVDEEAGYIRLHSKQKKGEETPSDVIYPHSRVMVKRRRSKLVYGDIKIPQLKIFWKGTLPNTLWARIYIGQVGCLNTSHGAIYVGI